MPRTELIDELIRDGVIIAHYDFRKRTLRDLAGVGGDATPGDTTNVIHNRRGYSVSTGGPNAVTIPNSAPLQAANDGTVMWWGRQRWPGAVKYTIIKGYPDFSLVWLAVDGRLQFRSNAGTSVLNGLTGQYRTLGLDYYSTTTAPAMYTDGEFFGHFGAARAVTMDNNNCLLGGSGGANSGIGLGTVYEGLIWTHRRLTAQEHRQIYRELMA